MPHPAAQTDHRKQLRGRDERRIDRTGAAREGEDTSRPSYDDLLMALEGLVTAVRDYDRYGSDDDLAERNRCADSAADVVAKARRSA